VYYAGRSRLRLEIKTVAMNRAAVLICGIGLQEHKMTVLPEWGIIEYSLMNKDRSDLLIDR